MEIVVSTAAVCFNFHANYKLPECSLWFHSHFFKKSYVVRRKFANCIFFKQVGAVLDDALECAGPLHGLNRQIELPLLLGERKGTKPQPS